MSSKEKDAENEDEKLKNENEKILEMEQKVNQSKPKKMESKEEEKQPELQEKKQSKPKESKEDSKAKNQKLWKIIVIAIVLILILLFSTIFSLLNLGKQTIAQGVTIKGIDVSNLTMDEATKKMNEAVNVELMLAMELKYGENYQVDFYANQIQYMYDVTDCVKEAYQIGKEDNIIVNNYTLLKTALFGRNIEMEGTYNENSLNGVVDDIASKVPGLVVQASYYREGNELIIDKGQKGIAIRKDKLKNDILENMKNRNALEIIQDGKKQSVEIEVDNIEPEAVDIDKIYQEVHTEPQDAYYIAQPFQLFKEQEGVDFAISLEEAKQIVATENQEEYIIPLKLTPAAKTVADIGTEAFPYLISSYTTKYDASNTNRSGNLKIAAGKINGTVLMAGEEFSFNEVVGKRTIEDGYTDAKIYENGKVVDGLAGGICQISSTLYNAVLLANLEITERRNHSYTTSYVAAGRDATVVYGVQDFKFKNTRTYPIKIEANVANGIVEFKIHGIKETVEYEIKIIPTTTQTIPYETQYVPDGTLLPGQQVVEQAGHSGYKVTTYIEKRLAGAVISKEVLSNDTYNAMKTIVHVGQ